ncbi:MAG: DUF3500 domain-containing protein [Planctomycetota bacterium]|nr:DUF3500 domain-containing protein [Planctomycetota bacterium]
MTNPIKMQPDCCGEQEVPRRTFLKSTAIATIGSACAVPLFNLSSLAADELPKASSAAVASKPASSTPETLVKALYDSCTPKQRSEICLDWDHQDKQRGLLRTFVANNWQITPYELNDDYYTKEQRKLVREIFKGIIQPDWLSRIDKQLKDDAGGFGFDQSLAIFGKPGEDKFEFVLTGRHMTLRCDGNSTDHVAFGGPIFYGHAADGFNEKPDHPGNVFWPQAVAANKVYQMLDARQREASLMDRLIPEKNVHFRGPEGKLPGIPVKQLSGDQKAELQTVLAKLIEPYRQTDRDEALECLKAQGGLEKCSLAFFKEGDLGNDQVWDSWRLEGPSFVWAFRGSPHVHVWVNIADDHRVKTNSG